MSEQTYGASVEFGDEIGPLVQTIDGTDVQKFLSVWMVRSSTPETSRFTDGDAARAEGLASPIVPGNMTQALLTRLLTDWAGPAGWVRTLDVNFRRPAHHGQEFRCFGLVTDKREEGTTTIVKLDVYVENPDGDRPVQGVAEVVLPTS